MRFHSFQYIPSTPRVFLSALPLSYYFISPTFPFLPFLLFFMSCTRKTYLWTAVLDLPLYTISFYIFSTTYVIPSYSSSPFCHFLPYSPVIYGGQPLFFWHIHFVNFTISTNFLAPLFVSSACISSSALTRLL